MKTLGNKVFSIVLVVSLAGLMTGCKGTASSASSEKTTEQPTKTQSAAQPLSPTDTIKPKKATEDY